MYANANYDESQIIGEGLQAWHSLSKTFQTRVQDELNCQFELFCAAKGFHKKIFRIMKMLRYYKKLANSPLISAIIHCLVLQVNKVTEV